MLTRWLIILVVPWSLWGCPKVGTCERGADCPGVADGGASADAGNPVVVCSPECAEADECVAGTCLPRYASVTLSAPQSGLAFRPGSKLTARATLEPAVGRNINPPMKLTALMVYPDSSTHAFDLLRDGADYQGFVTLGTTEGSYTLTAKYEAGNLSSAPVSLLVDTTGPIFYVEVPTAPLRGSDGGTDYADPKFSLNQAFRRDETIEVHVSSDATDVDSATVELTATFDEGAFTSFPLVRATDCSGGKPYCAKAIVNLRQANWDNTYQTFRNTLTFTAVGKDLTNNEGHFGSAEIWVTRWKWARQVDTSPLQGSPALSYDGTIIIGSASDGGTTGKLQAIRSDGSLAWEKTNLGAIIGSPVVGGSAQQPTVYVPASSANGAELLAFRVTDGAAVGAPCALPSGSSEASIFLSQTTYGTESQPFETATALVPGSSTLVATRPGSPHTCLSTPGAGGLPVKGTVSGSGTSLYYIDSNGDLQGYQFDSATAWTSQFTPIGGNLDSLGLAFSGSEWVGARGAGLFSVSPSGIANWSLATAKPTSLPVIGKAGTVWVGVEGGLMFKTTVGAASGQSQAWAPPEFALTAGLVLGEDGTLYGVDDRGWITGRSTAVYSRFWGEPVGGTLSPPNLDCSRDATGAKLTGHPGVIYVASSTGWLYAFIADSSGIDASAPWPRYQHDPRNTGNADTSLAEFSCP